MQDEVITLSSEDENDKKDVKLNQVVKKKAKLKVLRKDDKYVVLYFM